MLQEWAVWKIGRTTGRQVSELAVWLIGRLVDWTIGESKS